MARPKSNTNMLIDLGKGEDAIYNISRYYCLLGYNMTIKKVCKTLKCSRDWLRRYIASNVHYMYATIDTSETRKAAYNGRACVWYCQPEFWELIEKYSTFEVRTKQIPLENFIDAPSKEVAVYMLDHCIKKLQEKHKNESWRVCQGYRQFVEEHLNNFGQKLLSNAENPKLRGGVEWEPYTWPHETEPLQRYNLRTVASMKDYGDIDEEIYREIFADGDVKMNLRIPSADGKPSDMTYYLPDPDPVDRTINPTLLSYLEANVCVSYDFYMRHKNECRNIARYN